MSFFMGRSGFITTEDEYNDKLSVTSVKDALSGSTGLSAIAGENFGLANQEVTVSCRNKNRTISSYLSEPLRFSAKVSWKELFGGGIGSLVGTGMGMVDNIAQAFGGFTIQQPWMNRKLYQNTSPLSFTLSLNFVAESKSEAKEQVWDPVVALMSFAYPREERQDNDKRENAVTLIGKGLKNVGTGGMGEWVTDQGTKYQTDGGGLDTDSAGLIGAMAHLTTIYNIPGPSLLNDKGDPVVISIGRYMLFDHCYIDNIDCEIGNVMTDEGYPLQANVKLSVTNANGSVVRYNETNRDWDFIFSKFGDTGNEVNDAIEAVMKRAKEVVDKGQETVRKNIEFYKSFSTTGAS